MYKFNKESLLEESKSLDFGEVEFDSLFESLGIEDESVQAQLQEAFVLASRTGAVALTEAHLTQLVESAQAEVDTLVEQAKTDFEGKLQESIDDLLVNISTEWLNENRLAVENTVKAEQFDSLVTSLKESLIQHNFSIPEDKVDLYEELALSEKESHELANKYFKQNVALTEEINAMKRDNLIATLSEGMVESQREKFVDLAKAMKLDESFETRLETLSESLTNGFQATQKTKSKEEQLLEGLKVGAKIETKAVEDAPLNEGKQGEQKPTRQLSVDELLIRGM